MKNIIKHLSLALALLLVFTLCSGEMTLAANAAKNNDDEEIEFDGPTFSAGAYHSVFIWPDGTVGAVGQTKNGRCDVEDWVDIIEVSASSHTVGLKADGTVVAVGPNGHGQCDVENWKDIIAIAASTDHTVGLYANGTVVATGNSDHNRCDVSDWRDIVAITAGSKNTYGLKSNGKVVAVGSNASEQRDIGSWSKIQAISAGSNHVVGLKEDGTVIAAGSNYFGQCDVDDWKDIVAVSAGHHYTLGLKEDGTVLSTNEEEIPTRSWRDIVAISAGQVHAIGQHSDGTLVATGNQGNGRCDLDEDAVVLSASGRGQFTLAGNVVQVATCQGQIAVLRSDGTVRVDGDNTYGQCDVEDWENVIKIWADPYITFGVTKDGKVLATSGDYSGWSDVENIFIDRDYFEQSDIKLTPYVYAVKTDGTVMVTGAYGSLTDKDFADWKDIESIYVSEHYSYVLGLSRDDSLMMLDKGKSSKVLSDVKSIHSEFGHLFAITKNGDVYKLEKYDNGDTYFRDWKMKNIESLAVRIPNVLYGITKDGIIVSSNADVPYENWYHDKDSLDHFKNIVAIGAGRYDWIMALQEDGSIACYPEENYTNRDEWTNIVEIKNFEGDVLAALREDGKLLVEFYDGFLTYNWGEIADFWLPYYDTLIALTKDGKLLKTTISGLDINTEDYPVEELSHLTADVKN